jgi:hypothetical protein
MRGGADRVSLDRYCLFARDAFPSLEQRPRPMRTLAAFNQPIDAHLLIARLGGSGIPAFARDEHMVTLDWLAANAIGGIKVEVADEDYAKALEVMRSPANEEKNG